MTNEELKQKCLEYDKRYPTNDIHFTGMDLYYFITEGSSVFTSYMLRDWGKDLENFISNITMEIQGYKLKMICEACPEQYDVFKDGEQVGYLVFRYGRFLAETNAYGGEIVYEALVKNGDFPKNKNNPHLKAAIKAIDKSLNPE